MIALVRKFFAQDESGQGLVEYALLVGLIALAVVGAVIAFGGKLTTTFQSATDALPAGVGGSVTD